MIKKIIFAAAIIIIFFQLIINLLWLVLVITAAIGALYGLYKSAMAFVFSVGEHINPYTSYTDKSANAPDGVRRNYFFGPGIHQVSSTVKGTFDELYEQKNKLDDFKRNRTGDKWYLDVWIHIFCFVCTGFLFVFGSAWAALFSAILTIPIFVGMGAFFVFFSVFWLFDRFTLAVKSIHSRCGICKQLCIVPNFACPDCDKEHKKMTPGSYGVIWRKCSCGKFLSVNFFNGRSKLKASCPYCTGGLAASDSRQFGIQVVGGVSAGKTTFLASFWHEYIAMLESGGIEYEKHPEDAFAQLEEWFNQGVSSATTVTNAAMYSVVHKLSEKLSFQLALYDIAGESFADIGYEVQQRQFQYCEGFIFVIDPLASPDATGGVIASFAQTFKELTGKHSGEVSSIPAAVVISKADLFKREIGLPKILTTYRKQPEMFVDSEGRSSIDYTRDGLCRMFLENRDFSPVLNILGAEFSNVRFYPVSAIGGEGEYGAAYEPWGVFEPVEWILQNADSEFKEKILQHRRVSQ